MKQEQVIAWAREVGLPPCAYDDYGNHIKNLESFAALVAAAEREECAKLIERTDLSGMRYEPNIQLLFASILNAHIKAIRARALHNINKAAEKNGEEL